VGLDRGSFGIRKLPENKIHPARARLSSGFSANEVSAKMALVTQVNQGQSPYELDLPIR
jgi:hypothetical protein